MKKSFCLLALFAICAPTALLAQSEKDAVKAVINAVKQGNDLGTIFPGAITAKEIASLKRVAKCAALNLMKQKAGDYTVVWDCGSKGALGMRVTVDQGKVTTISTMEVLVRPNAP